MGISLIHLSITNQFKQIHLFNMEHNEHSLQVQCVKWFKLQYPREIIFAIPNGGKRFYSTAKRLSAEGLLAGIPDLMIPTPNSEFHGLFIEMKYGKNTTSKQQKIIIESLKAKGYKCEVVKSFEAFTLLVNTYYSQM
jgi:hypothetical protein